MINPPVSITTPCFQTAWLEVVKLLIDNQWKLRNLIVHIENPAIFCQDFHQNICQFTEQVGLLGPKDVAYTIFPHKLYTKKRNQKELIESYNRPNGLFARIQNRKRSWGSYFRRMTYYETKSGTIQNQLENIILAIKARSSISTAAYTIIIQKPGGETIRPLGGPCLNYIAVQLESGNSVQLGLLAVYRNHDFLERAYGNYWGLCNLISFLAKETGTTPGPLTCISSKAYVSGKKTDLRSLVDSL
jgi:thymidylate synthase